MHGGGPCHAIFTGEPSGFSPELFTVTRMCSEIISLGSLSDAQLALDTDPMDGTPDLDTIERVCETLSMVGCTIVSFGRYHTQGLIGKHTSGSCHIPLQRRHKGSMCFVASSIDQMGYSLEQEWSRPG